MHSGSAADALYIQHMLECIDRIMEYTCGDEVLFRSSRLIQDAALRNLQTMAESSQRLSANTKKLEPGIPWRALSGFRNIITHNYLGIDPDIVWQVIATELPPLQEALLRLQTAARNRA